MTVDWIVPWLSNNEFVAYGDKGRYLMFTLAFAMFGVSWFGSCVFESPSIVVVVGLTVPIILMYASVLSEIHFGWPVTENTKFLLFTGTQTATGLIGFVGGWIYFLRKVEP